MLFTYLGDANFIYEENEVWNYKYLHQGYAYDNFVK